MKKKFRFLLATVIIIIFCLSKTDISAQTSMPIIYKDWTVLDESKSRVEVSYRILKCNAINQIHLSVNNKNISDQAVIFSIQVIDNLNKLSFSKQVMQVSEHLKTNKAECGNDNIVDALKIDLPDTYEPNNLTVIAKFGE